MKNIEGIKRIKFIIMDHVVIVLGCSESLPITILKYNVTLPTLAYPFLVTSFFVPASEVGQ